MRKMRWAHMAMVGALFLGCAGPSYKLNLKPYELTGTDYPFPSGLRVFVQPDHSQSNVLVYSVVDVGGQDEPEGKEGMAHVVEHLCFRAKHADNPPVMTQVRQMGAVLNATTNLDKTDYFTMAPKDSLYELLKIEAQRMQGSKAVERVSADELKIEREVVRNELRLNHENRAFGKLFDQLQWLLYPEDHPYGGSNVIGTHDSLDNITIDDIHAFTDKWYRPENFTLVIVGDVTPEEASKAIQSTIPKKLIMGDAEKLELVTPEPRVTEDRIEPPPPQVSEVQRMKGPVNTTTVFLAWSLPGAYRNDEPLIETTVRAMTYAVGSFMNPDFEIRHRGEVSDYGCFPQLAEHGTQAVCYIELVEGQDPDKILERAKDGLVEMWRSENEMFQRQLFAQARAEYMADLFRSSASIWRGLPIGESIHFTAQPDAYSKKIRNISKMNAFDMRNLAYKYLTRERAVSIIVEPYDPDEEGLNVAFDKGSSYAGATLAPESKANLDVFAKLKAEHIKAIAMMPDMSNIKDVTLDNGLRVIIKNHGSTPFVHVGLYTGGGLATTDPVGLSSFIRTREQSRNPLEIASTWTGYNAADHQVMGVEGPSGNLHALLDLLSDRVSTTKLNYKSQDLKAAVTRAKRRLEVAERRPEIWADRAAWRLLMHDHPLAQLQDMDYDAVLAAGQATFKTTLESRLAPKNAVLVIVGDVSPEKAMPLVQQTWGKWRADDPGQPAKMLPAPGDPPKRQIAFIDRPDATQSNVTIACHLQPHENPAVNDVLSKYLNEELWFNLRERFGATYGVYSGVREYPGGTHLLFIRGAITNDKAIQSLQIMMNDLEQLKKGKATYAKLMKAKWNVARGTITANQSPAEMQATIIDMIRKGESLDSLESYPQELADVTKEDLANVLQSCVGHEVVAITGPRQLVYKPLTAMNIPIDPVDWRAGSNAESSVKTETN